jgi:hypothetical protein
MIFFLIIYALRPLKLSLNPKTGIYENQKMKMNFHFFSHNVCLGTPRLNNYIYNIFPLIFNSFILFYLIGK